MKQLTIQQIISAVQVLGSARLTKLSSAADKYQLIKAIRALKPTAEAFEDFKRETLQKLQADDHAQHIANFQQMQAEERLIREGSLQGYTLPVAVMVKTAQYIKQYDHDADFCLRQELKKTVSVAIDPLPDALVAALIDSNPDWNVEECSIADEILS